MSKRGRKPVSQEFIDDSDDPEDTGAKTKKAKAEATRSFESTDDDMIEISNKRFVNVRVFNGRFLVDIREYWYDDAGTRKPGKKGISLTVEQWSKLKEAIPQIDAKISSTSK